MDAMTAGLRADVAGEVNAGHDEGIEGDGEV